MKHEIIYCDQGTPEWQSFKLGVVSGSNIHRALTKKGSETRNTYLMELVGQIATRQFDDVFGKALEHGKANEDTGRAAYEFETGHKVEQVGFVYGMNRRIGVSPDGLIPSLKKGFEQKCPITAKVHADFLCNSKVKSEYQLQMQLGLWILEYESWDFSSWQPMFKSKMLGIKTFEPDREVFERFENEIPPFLDELDSALAKLEISFGDQWK
jgi:hypothetical protein